MPVSGLRTATAHDAGPRIITPSITACPPIEGFGGPSLTAARLELRERPAAVFPLEPLDPSTGVHELLLARVERVALGADLHAQLRLRGTGGVRVPARAVHGRGTVRRVDTLFHRSSFRPPQRNRRAPHSARASVADGDL